MEGSNTSNFFSIAVITVVGAILLCLVCRPIDPNTELARTTRDAGSGTESAVLLAGRFRLLAVAVGVTVPLIVVYAPHPAWLVGIIHERVGVPRGDLNHFLKVHHQSPKAMCRYQARR